MGDLDIAPTSATDLYTIPLFNDKYTCFCSHTLYKGDCMCTAPGFFFNEETKICEACNSCSHDKFGCPLRCPARTFRASQACCDPCHYTCDSCVAGGEHDCRSCKTDQFGNHAFAGKDDGSTPLEYLGQTYCLCPCGTRQVNEECWLNVMSP